MEMYFSINWKNLENFDLEQNEKYLNYINLFFLKERQKLCHKFH